MVIWDSKVLSCRTAIDAMQCTANVSHEQAGKQSIQFAGRISRSSHRARTSLARPYDLNRFEQFLVCCSEQRLGITGRRRSKNYNNKITPLPDHGPLPVFCSHNLSSPPLSVRRLRFKIFRCAIFMVLTCWSDAPCAGCGPSAHTRAIPTSAKARIRMSSSIRLMTPCSSRRTSPLETQECLRVTAVPRSSGAHPSPGDVPLARPQKKTLRLVFSPSDHVARWPICHSVS